MRKIAIVIPVKGRNPKGRLATLFGAKQRKQLQLAMLEDALQAIGTAGKLSEAYVVSSDLEILKFADRFGVGSVVESKDEGVNQAVERAISNLDGYDGWLVIPADLPLISANDIKTVLELVRMGSLVIISPSEDYSGTNMLLMSRKARIRLHYDDDSFNKHVREASSKKVRFAVYYSQSVSFDIDSAVDVHRYFAFGSRNSTMNFLERTLKKGRIAERSLREKLGKGPGSEA